MDIGELDAPLPTEAKFDPKTGVRRGIKNKNRILLSTNVGANPDTFSIAQRHSRETTLEIGNETFNANLNSRFVVTYSLNKRKRWELIPHLGDEDDEETEDNDVETQSDGEISYYVKVSPHTSRVEKVERSTYTDFRDYVTNESYSDNEEIEYKLVKTRKGKKYVPVTPIKPRVAPNHRSAQQFKAGKAKYLVCVRTQPDKATLNRYQQKARIGCSCSYCRPEGSRRIKMRRDLLNDIKNDF